jgi:hypothetical protein
MMGRVLFYESFTRAKDQGRLVPPLLYVAARSVRDWMEQSRLSKADHSLDSCFSGAFAKGVKAKR